MFGFVTNKEVLKASKRITVKLEDGTEQRCLIDIDNFDSIPLKCVISYTISGDWRGIPIMAEVEKLDDNDERGSLLFKMYADKKIPSLKLVFEKIAEFVTTTPDQSNIGGGPRTITVEDLQTAMKNYMMDGDINRARDFAHAPASIAYHDNQKGGLIRHIAKMVELTIVSMSAHSFNEYEVHPLVLMIGVLTHDIGKVDAYEGDSEKGYVSTEYASYRGGHLGMSLERWARNGRQFLKDLKVPDVDINKLYWDVWHLIGSSHGPVPNGFGSLMNPFGHDAWTLHSIDMLESRQEESIKPVRTE